MKSPQRSHESVAGLFGCAAQCPCGPAGANAGAPGTGATVVESHPIFTPSTLSPAWIVWARNSGADSTLSVYALCATAS